MPDTTTTDRIPKFIKSAIKRCLQPHSLYLSQAGQDLWVCGEVFNEKRNGYFVDLGAHDGVLISNTYLLEQKYGWSGLCVEGNPDTFQRLEKNRRATCVNVCLDAVNGFANFAKRDVMGGIIAADTDNKELPDESEEVIQVQTRTLASVLLENNAPAVIDYLSVDIEGSEERVLGNFDFDKYLFKSLTIERPTETLGAVFKAKGYLLVRDIPGLDCFYIHESISNDYLANVFAFYRKKRLTVRWT